ncbi:AmmeMemoRadiSam system protein A [Kaarinaea lacus]
MSLSKDDQKTLLQVAKLSIEFGLQSGGRQRLELDANSYEETLRLERASFVTLNLHGNLRGCIGSLEAHQALVLDVCHNAHSAAFGDPRFAPLSPQEFKDLDIHISILTPAEPMNFGSQEDLIAQLQPGIDGLILQEGYHRGTFLPSVWESLPQPEQFLQHLKLKAGLPPDYWSDSVQMFRYTTESFGNESA